MALEHTSALHCADCGLFIADTEDVDVTLDAAGNVVIALHTDAFHRELIGDEDAGVSPFDYAGTQTVRSCDICTLAIEPVTVTRCGNCLGCVDGSRCELPSPVLCPVCEAQS